MSHYTTGQESLVLFVDIPEQGSAAVLLDPVGCAEVAVPAAVHVAYIVALDTVVLQWHTAPLLSDRQRHCDESLPPGSEGRWKGPLSRH